MSDIEGTAGPIPLFALPLPPSSRSRRCIRRWQRKSQVCTVANTTIRALNSLAPLPSSPISPVHYQSNSTVYYQRDSTVHQPPDYRRPPYAPSFTSFSQCHIYRECARFLDNIRVRHHSDGLGDLPLYVTDPELIDLSGMDMFTTSYVGHSAPVPIIADKVSLPAIAGRVQILDVLPKHIAQIYSSPLSITLSNLVTRAHSGRTPTVLGSSIEYEKLVIRMLNSGMVVVMRQRPLVVNGIFCVPKADGSKLRLIVDGRQTNTRMVSPPWFPLPTPDALAKLSTDQDGPLFVAKTDLKDMFYQFALPLWAIPYFGLPPVKASSIGMSGEDIVWPCMRCLPMGWSHSPYLAQIGHQHLISLHTTIPHVNLVLPGHDYKLDRTRLAVYIDDVTFIGHDVDEVKANVDQYISGMNRAHVPVSMDKLIPPTDTGVECIGMMIDGKSRRMQLHPTKALKLLQDTYALIHYGYANQRAMQAIIGRWTWPMLIRRPALSTFSAVYAFIQRTSRRIAPLPHQVIQELTTACGLLPLLYADFSTSFAPFVVCSDASSTGQGVSYQPCDLQTVSLLSSEAMVNTDLHHTQSVQSIRLFQQSQEHLGISRSLNIPTFSRGHGVRPAAVPLIWRSFTEEGRWIHCISSRWKKQEHIDGLELQAVNAALRWSLSRPCALGRRLLFASDSTVVVGAIGKGRSSTFRLLWRMRLMALLLLASGTYLNVVWLRSGDNPADYPSRLHSSR